MALIRPGPLPTYAWARTPVAGVPRDGWERGLPAVTALDPGALPDAPPATTGDLVQLGHPLIRTLGATTVMALSGESAFVGSAAGSDRVVAVLEKLWLSSLWGGTGV